MANKKNATEQMVTIRLPLTNTLKDDVFVSVNNCTWQIQRGKTVEVPACVAEVLRHSEEMAEEAIRYQAQVISAE